MSDHPDRNRPRREDDPTVTEQLGESIRSEDKPIKDPSTPLALVMGSYPVILIMLLLILAVYFFWFRARPGAERVDEPARPTEVDPVDAGAIDPVN
jgi:hypothetical protein